jgi:hypothetical protein
MVEECERGNGVVGGRIRKYRAVVAGGRSESPHCSILSVAPTHTLQYSVRANMTVSEAFSTQILIFAGMSTFFKPGLHGGLTT